MNTTHPVMEEKASQTEERVLCPLCEQWVELSETTVIFVAQFSQCFCRGVVGCVDCSERVKEYAKNQLSSEGLLFLSGNSLFRRRN